ncbi:hypothetical protein LCGC14_1511580, partial [marine sediment metagenome]
SPGGAIQDIVTELGVGSIHTDLLSIDGFLDVLTNSGSWGLGSITEGGSYSLGSVVNELDFISGSQTYGLGAIVGELNSGSVFNELQGVNAALGIVTGGGSWGFGHITQGGTSTLVEVQQAIDSITQGGTYSLATCVSAGGNNVATEVADLNGAGWAGPSVLTDGSQRTKLYDAAPGPVDVVSLASITAPDLDGVLALAVASAMMARTDANTLEGVSQSGTPHFAAHQKDMDGNSASKTDWAQLTAPGSTASYQPNFVAKRHVLQVVLANKDTNVVVSLQGSVDNSNWYDLESEATYTADGTYHIQSDAYAPYARGTFVSEAGGTNAQVTFKWYGAR